VKDGEQMPELDPDAVRLVNEALAELRKRGVKNDYCPRCETFDWDVEPIAINVIPLRGVPAFIPHAYFAGQIMLLQVVCKNCGYTMFHNLNVLNLAPQTRR
jgi:hypothetical protein